MFKTQDYPENVPSATQGEAVSVAAPGLVGAGGTTLEDFQRWLETKANEAHAQYSQGPEGETLWQEVERCKPVTLLIAECRVATKLLMQFKLEQSK